MKPCLYDLESRALSRTHWWFAERFDRRWHPRAVNDDGDLAA